MTDLFSVLSGATSGGANNPSTPSSSVASGNPAGNNPATGQPQQPSSGVWPGMPSNGGPGSGMGGMFTDLVGRMPGMLKAMNQPLPQGGMSPIGAFGQGMASQNRQPKMANDWASQLFNLDRFKALRQDPYLQNPQSFTGTEIKPDPSMNASGKMIDPMRMARELHRKQMAMPRENEGY